MKINYLYIGCCLFFGILLGCNKPPFPTEHNKLSIEENVPCKIITIDRSYTFHDGVTVKHTLVYDEFVDLETCLNGDVMVYENKKEKFSIKRVDLLNASDEEVFDQFFIMLDMLNRFTEKRMDWKEFYVKEFESITDISKYFKHFELVKDKIYEGRIFSEYGIEKHCVLSGKSITIQNLDKLSSFYFFEKMQIKRDVEKARVNIAGESGFNISIPRAVYCRYGAVFGRSVDQLNKK